MLVQLKNSIYKELFTLLHQGTDVAGVPAHVQKEPVAFIRLAQEKWEGKLKQAINKLCTTYRVGLSRQVGILTEGGRNGVWFCFCLETSSGEGNSKEKMELYWSRLSR